MIVPNLMVTEMRRSISFYRDSLGMTLTMTISAQREMATDGDNDGVGAAFATLEWNGGQLMLQTVASLSEELSVFDAKQRPTPSGTTYFRGLHPKAVLDRISKDQIVKGPVQQWYGMMELYLCDPDGHIICLGAPEGPPPM